MDVKHHLVCFVKSLKKLNSLLNFYLYAYKIMPYFFMVKESLKLFSIYCFWCFINVCVNELHYMFCQPTLWRFLMVPIYNEMPYCRTFVWLQYHAKTTTYQLYASFMTWTVQFMITHLKLHKED